MPPRRPEPLGWTVEHILPDLKPEAAYFFANDEGQRSGSIVFDMKTRQRFPRSLSRGFSPSTQGCRSGRSMNPQDLAKAVHRLARLLSDTERKI
jgi:hypothetical protein